MQTLVPHYEEVLRKDSRWALNEAGKYFEDRAKVQITLKKIARRLNDLGIDYAIVGGMALTHHGFVRFTNDVDIVVTRESNAELHSRLEGLGYLPPFEKSKNLRDTDSGVKIEFLITGEFPGDGKPKPVAFPNPKDVREFDADGIAYLKLETLIELKLASGMSNTDRMKDLSDVQELIRHLSLDDKYALKLNEYVRAKFIEIWQGTVRAHLDPFA